MKLRHLAFRYSDLFRVTHKVRAASFSWIKVRKATAPGLVGTAIRGRGFRTWVSGKTSTAATPRWLLESDPMQYASPPWDPLMTHEVL